MSVIELPSGPSMVDNYLTLAAAWSCPFRDVGVLVSKRLRQARNYNPAIRREVFVAWLVRRELANRPLVPGH